MLRGARELHRYEVHAVDGDVGRVHDLHFDDQRWTVRHLVVTCGRWLPGRRVLLVPMSVRGVDARRRDLQVALTRTQMEHSPGIEADEPVSRQHAVEIYQYFGFPYDWLGPVHPGDPPSERHGDPHLRSAREMSGYHIHGRDGEIGHVEDFLIDDESWAIRYLVVDTRNWWPGKCVLIAPAWIAWASWGEAAVHVRLERDTIRHAPLYDPSRAVDREYEARLHEHYGQVPKQPRAGHPSGRQNGTTTP